MPQISLCKSYFLISISYATSPENLEKMDLVKYLLKGSNGNTVICWKEYKSRLYFGAKTNYVLIRR